MAKLTDEQRRALEALARKDHDRLLRILGGNHALLLRVLQPKEAALSSVEYLDTIENAEHAAQLLFKVIQAMHGRDAAYRMLVGLAKFFSPPSAAQRNQFKNDAILAMYDRDDEPNVQRLALLLTTKNKALPKAKRWGPRGTTNPMTMDKHIRRLLKAREGLMKRIFDD
jgi:hypothetical protein